MNQFRIGMLAAGLALAVALVAAPGVLAGDGKRVEIVRHVGGGGAYLGVGIDDPGGSERGALVKDVVEGSPAEKAGLKEGDVIARFDGEAVRSASHLARLVSETPTGRAVAIEARRAGATQKLEATLAESKGRRARFFGLDELADWAPEPPEPPDAPSAPAAPSAPRAPRTLRTPELRHFEFPWDAEAPPLLSWSSRPRRLGITYQSVEGQLAKYFKVPGDEAVLVTSVDEGGPAAKGGLKAGDVILKLDGKAIEDDRDLRRALDKAGSGSEVPVQVLREGKGLDLKVTLGGEKEKAKLDEEDET